MAAKPEVTRPFGLLDLMVLVVAFGTAFMILGEHYRNYRGPATPSTWRTENAIFAVANSTLMPLTLAFAVIMLRGPRPRVRGLLQRPGTAACMAAAAAILVMIARMWIKVYAMHRRKGEPFELRLLYHWIVSSHVRVGFAVLGAWVALLLTRGWRPQPSWVDRSGRVLGLGWLALTLFHVLLPWIEPVLPPI